MKSPRDRTTAILAACGDADAAGQILANLIGRLECSASVSTLGTACAAYAKRLCMQRSTALWALDQVEAAAASVLRLKDPAAAVEAALAAVAGTAGGAS